ncbi:hypothetical protein RJ641_004962 [Dillenia turbinata]|uniref:Uncharacterized protein n=1 Tax=Dillenia turbinata TaxID=194707 RepID=A0AAN8Z8J3_9MAGN
MAALSLCHSCPGKNIKSLQNLRNKSRTRTLISLACQSQEEVDPPNANAKNAKIESKQLLSSMLVSVEKLGKGLKDNLSPKQKGDWKDLMLMSLSFGVYVYISQKLVCAYCAWMSMLKQPCFPLVAFRNALQIKEHLSTLQIFNIQCVKFQQGTDNWK